MPARHPYRRGDVLLVPFRYSSAVGHKERPAVVISTDTYHDQWDELLVAAITSRPPRTSRPTDCVISDWQAAGLNQPSWMRSHLATLRRQLLRSKLGKLSLADLQAVEACLRIAQGL